MRRLLPLLLLASCPAPPVEEPTLAPCEDVEAQAAATASLRGAFDALSDGVPAVPVTRVLDDSGNGTLQVGLHPDAFPVYAGSAGVHAAVTRIGDGRVVAFSGQDFLSSGDRSTLLVDSEVPALLRNAAAWAGGGDSLRVLADNAAVAAVLTGHEVDVTPVVEVNGLREIKDWSATALADYDLAVVQINEWGTLKVADEDLPALRDFVADGGGLLIAGAALHWSWWLWDQGPAYPGDALLADFGITWDRVIAGDLTDAELAFDELSSPEALWCAWVRGDALDDDVLPRVAPLFGEATDRPDELATALARLVDEAPALPVPAASGEARLHANVAAGLHAVRWPGDGHPWSATFPGAVASADRSTVTTSVDTAWKRGRPLGAYAAPGDVVTITVPAEHAGAGLSLRLGDFHDDLRGLAHIEEWRRPPLLFAEYAVDDPTTTIGTGLGGALYLHVPDDYPDTTVEVTVTDAVPMAVHSPGYPDFATTLAAGAPRAIIETPGKVSLVVAADAAAEADPPAVAAFWEGFYDQHVELAQEPEARNWVSHWLFDPQVGWGYANATAARINHPEPVTGQALRTDTGSEDWWLFAHELGHQFQTSDWTGGDVTEVCVNLWSMFTINRYIHDGGDFETRGHQDNAMDHAALIGTTWEPAGLFEKLELYRQLVFEFGWPTYQQVFASYYDPAYPRGTYGDFMDGFALRFSAIAGVDLTPFLDRWEYPYSDAARARIQGWGLEPWMPPGW
jgi:hypothetical protein